MPDWSIEELEEMGYNMKCLIDKEMEHKETIKKRLMWHTTIPTMIITKYLENEEVPQEEVTTHFKDRQRNLLIRDMLDTE